MWDYRDIGRTLLVATTLCVTALGCGSAGTAPAASATAAMPQRIPPADLVTYLPADTVGVVRLDMGPLRSQPWISDLMNLAMARQPDADPAALRDLIERTDEVVMGLRERGGSSGHKVVLMRGRYGSTNFGREVTTRYRAHSVAESAADGRLIARLEDHTLISGDIQMARATLDVVDGLARGNGPQSQIYRDAEARVGLRAHHITWLVAVPGFVLPSNNRLVSASRFLAMWVDVGQRLEAGAFLTISDPGWLPVLDEVVEVLLTRASSNPRTVELDLVWCLEQLRVGVEDGELRAQLSLDREQTNRLARALERALTTAP